MVPTEKIIPLTPSSNTQPEPTAADKIGGGIITMLKQTTQAARETADRAVRSLQRATDQLQQSEERVRRLEMELKQSQDRAQLAEQWLVRIQKELQDEVARGHRSGSINQLAPQGLVWNESLK